MFFLFLNIKFTNPQSTYRLNSLYAKHYWYTQNIIPKPTKKKKKKKTSFLPLGAYSSVSNSDRITIQCSML